MKKVSKFVLSVLVLTSLLIVMSSVHALASTVTSGNWKYEKNGTCVTLMGTTLSFTSSGSGLNIPKTIDGYTVDAIGTGAFSGSQFWFVNLPDTIKRIDSGAFSNCTNLSSVTIPKSVTGLGYGVFSNCNKLSLITIYGNPSLSPNALGSNKKTVRTYYSSSKVISFCNTYSSYLSLSYLDAVPPAPVDTNPTTFTYTDSYGTWTFDRTTSTITKYNGSSSWVTVPDQVKYAGKSYKVKTLGSKAFNGNKYITNLTLDTPNVNSHAVYGCNNLKTITLDWDVMFLDTYCFYYSQNVTTLKVYGNPITTYSFIYKNPSLYVFVDELSLHVRNYCRANNIRDSWDTIHVYKDTYQLSAFGATTQHGYGGLSDTVYFALAAAVGYQGAGNGLLEPTISDSTKYVAKRLLGIYYGWIKERYPNTWQQYVTPDYMYYKWTPSGTKWW